MIAGLFWMLVANAAILLGSHSLARRIRTPDEPVNVLLFLLLRLLLLSLTVLAAGLSGNLTPRGLGVAGAVLLAFLLIRGEHRTLKLPSRPEMGIGTALLAALIGFRMLAQVWLFAPYSSDALSYHLPKVAEWVRAGAFTREMGVDLCASLPAGFELIETWWVLFLHHDVLIEMAGVEFAVLAFFSVRALALQLGLSSRPAYLAGALYILTPLFSIQATSCLNDAPVAALVLSLAALVTARVPFTLILLPIGLVAGIKATGCFTFPGWLLLMLLRRPLPPLKPASPGLALSAGVAAIAVGSYWYLRNLLWYGNPLHPVGVTDPIFGQILVQTGPSLSSLGSNLAGLVDSLLYDRNRSLTTVSLETAGWGGLAFSCGAVALIGEMRKDRNLRQAAAAFGVALVCVLLMVLHDPWYARFVMFFPAILCIAAARLAETVRPVAVLVVLGAMVAFAAGLLPGDVRAEQMSTLMRQPWRERSSAELYEGPPPGDPVGVHIKGRMRLYFLYAPDLSRRVVYFRIAGSSRLLEEMERQGVRQIYVDRRNQRRKDFDDLLQQGRLRLLKKNYYGLP